LRPAVSISLNYIRSFRPQPVVEDKPEGLLAEDIAPNASEALLAAFGSCLALGIHANAIARRISVQRLELELEADINTPAVWGSGNIDPKPIGFEEGSRACFGPTRRGRFARSARRTRQACNPVVSSRQHASQPGASLDVTPAPAMERTTEQSGSETPAREVRHQLERYFIAVESFV
jgi:hypothetical protein